MKLAFNLKDTECCPEFGWVHLCQINGITCDHSTMHAPADWHHWSSTPKQESGHPVSYKSLWWAIPIAFSPNRDRWQQGEYIGKLYPKRQKKDIPICVEHDRALVSDHPLRREPLMQKLACQACKEPLQFPCFAIPFTRKFNSLSFREVQWTSPYSGVLCAESR